MKISSFVRGSLVAAFYLAAILVLIVMVIGRGYPKVGHDYGFFIPRMLENNSSIVTFLQTAEFFGLGLDYDRRLPSLLASVTLEDVNRAAASVLDPSRACAVVAGPPLRGGDIESGFGTAGSP